MRAGDSRGKKKSGVFAIRKRGRTAFPNLVHRPVFAVLAQDGAYGESQAGRRWVSPQTL